MYGITGFTAFILFMAFCRLTEQGDINMLSGFGIIFIFLSVLALSIHLSNKKGGAECCQYIYKDRPTLTKHE